MQQKWLKLKNGKVCNMRYHDITKEDMLNGDGLRVVLWVSGCAHACEGCQNPITWDPEDGLLFDGSARIEIYEQLEKDYISGLTLSGGDPLYINNRADVECLLSDIKDKFPDKNIWLYTGYLWEEICELPLMKYLDVVVDGRFVLAEADNTLYWKGSKNQRVVDVQCSLKQGQVILHERQ